MADDLLRMAERTTIYVSSTDKALLWARRLFRRERLGQMFNKEDLRPQVVGFMQANPSLQFIDVTDAAGSTTGNGHSYFRNSPWVSSDILALLISDLGAAERGLETDGDSFVYQFPPDYIQRLQEVLINRNPDWKGTRHESDNGYAPKDRRQTN